MAPRNLQYQIGIGIETANDTVLTGMSGKRVEAGVKTTVVSGIITTRGPQHRPLRKSDIEVADMRAARRNKLLQKERLDSSHRRRIHRLV